MCYNTLMYTAYLLVLLKMLSKFIVHSPVCPVPTDGKMTVSIFKDRKLKINEMLMRCFSRISLSQTLLTLAEV